MLHCNRLRPACFSLGRLLGCLIVISLSAIVVAEESSQEDKGPLPREMTDQLTAGATDQQIVDHLLAVRKKAGVSRALALHFPQLERDRAYRIQMRLLAKLEAAGERLVGWKMGGTKIGKAGEPLDPIFGFMLASDELHSGSTVAASCFAADTPIIEAEVGFWIGADLPGPKVSREAVRAAVSGVGGTCEIISTRHRDAQGGLTAGVTIGIADGLSHGGFLLPKQTVPLAEVDFDAEEGRVEINNELRARGAARVMMEGAPLDAIWELANRLIQHGHHLRKGDVVIIGSLLESPPAGAGDHVTIGFSSWDSLTIEFR